MVHVVDYDDVIISSFKTLPDYKYSWQSFDTWEEAKDSLVDYWDRAVYESKHRLKTAKKLKQKN